MRVEILVDMVRSLQDRDDLGLKDRDLRAQILVIRGAWKGLILQMENCEAHSCVAMLIFTAIGITLENLLGDNSAVFKALRDDTELPLTRESHLRNRVRELWLRQF